MAASFLFEPDEEAFATDDREQLGTISDASNNSKDVDSSWALQIIRRLEHSSWHISNLTFDLSRFHDLKPGASDEILTTLDQIRGHLSELKSKRCLDDFNKARLSETPQGRKRHA